MFLSDMMRYKGDLIQELCVEQECVPWRFIRGSMKSSPDIHFSDQLIFVVT